MGPLIATQTRSYLHSTPIGAVHLIAFPNKQMFQREAFCGITRPRVVRGRVGDWTYVYLGIAPKRPAVP